MLIIIDKKLPDEVKNNLKNYGEIYELETSDIVYDAIAGHPDIFIFQNNNKLIIAPQTPLTLIDKFKEHNIDFVIGDKTLGLKYPSTTPYNIANISDLFIGNNQYCDSKILELSKGKKWVQTKQSYARCNTLVLDSESVISSDHNLENRFKNTLLINTKDIILEGFEYGFIGGCAGIYKKSVFFTGSLKAHSQGQLIRQFCEERGFSIIELSDGKLIDSGGMFFIE